AGGAPSAGRRTLFNRMGGREAAPVSPFPATTRDALELHLDRGGYPVPVLDTAGIRETNDPVEREGVRRASEQAAGANLVLWVVDASASERQTLQLPAIKVASESITWLVVNKIDLLAGEEQRRIESRFDRKEIVNFVSS